MKNISGKHYDYIIVGGGTAGCVVASLLLERTNASILMLENGKMDTSLYARMPAAFYKLFAKDAWDYETIPEPYANNRKMPVPQGKCVGGSSSINGMVYIRGNKITFDNWEKEAGCIGWSYKDILPFFRGMENNETFSDEYHGINGHTWISDSRLRHPVSLAFIRAAQETGYPYNHDFNGEKQDGVGFYQSFIHRGERAGTRLSYLEAHLNNPNLTLLTSVLVRKVIFEGDTATGVEFEDEHGKIYKTYADKEVVLTAGTFGTPKVLLLSGVGPADDLKSLNIPVILDQKNLGQNLHDHLSCSFVMNLKKPISLQNQATGFGKIWSGLEWLISRDGAASSNILESGGFFDTSNKGYPDVQFITLPVKDDFDNRSGESDGVQGFSFKICSMHPKSRGYVKLNDNNPKTPLKIQLNYLAERADVEVFIRGIKLARKFCEAPSLFEIIDKIVMPNEDVKTDAQIEAHVRNSANTVYHPVGTCRMGSDPDAVVDTRLLVNGLKNLRIADASVIPIIPSGNTQASTIMVAERAVHFMLNK